MSMERNCREWVAAVVEFARTGSEEVAGVREHLQDCSNCRARWEDERRVTSDLRVLRDAAHLRKPSEARHNQILREFDLVRRRSARPSLKWALAAAAVVLLAIGVVELPRLHRTPLVAQLNVGQENSEPDSDASDFVDVPYAPPLAAGEFVSVVRTQLQPAALARMGIAVDLGYPNDIAADVMVGEDGLPRAVRLVDAIDF